MGITKIQLATSDMKRQVAKEADVLIHNRFLESNPVLSDGEAAYIARPGLKYWQTVGDGPIRAIFQQPGAFDDDMFIVSFNSLYRVVRATGATTLVTASLTGGATNTTVRMAATGDIGTAGPHLWVADGSQLLVYLENGFSTGTFTATAIADGDVVRLGAMYYRYSTGSLDTSAPAGTLANPWKVLIAGTILGSYTNLLNAINATGVAGTDYSTALTINLDASATSALLAGLSVRALLEGIAGDAVVTTETGANTAWGAATLTGGGGAEILTVETPDAVGIVDVANINNFIIAIPAQGEGKNGRFYWVRPGEIVIDALDYATAERSADPVYQCVVFNDQFWLPGQNTTEVYFMTGDNDAPVSRVQGVIFDRGTYPGTALQVKDSMVVVDNDGGVFQIRGGEKRISTPDIEERLRKAVAMQNINNP